MTLADVLVARTRRLADIAVWRSDDSITISTRLAEDVMPGDVMVFSHAVFRVVDAQRESRRVLLTVTGEDDDTLEWDLSPLEIVRVVNP